MRNEAITVAKRASSTFLTFLGVTALAVAVAVAPADAKKVKPDNKPAEETIADPANGEPMILVVSLGHQKVDVYRGTRLVTSSQVSTGMPGHATKAGVFSILEKQRFHHSNMYSGAPMPWMNRITWSGTALHAGVVPGYPASHGCIRLPFSFAPKLFQITTVGDNVIVTRERLAPKLIEHPNLFQPLPPPGRTAVHPAGRPAATRYRVLEDRGGTALVELTPETGRMHQLRIHLLHLGTPLLGDPAYDPAREGGDPRGPAAVSERLAGRSTPPHPGTV